MYLYVYSVYMYRNIYRCFLLLKERESKCGKNIHLQMKVIHPYVFIIPLIFLKVRTFQLNVTNLCFVVETMPGFELFW